MIDEVGAAISYNDRDQKKAISKKSLPISTCCRSSLLMSSKSQRFEAARTGRSIFMTLIKLTDLASEQIS